MTRRPGSGRRPIALKDRLLPVLISLLSVIVVFGVAAYFVTSAPQWPRIQLQFFSWEAIVEAFPSVARGFTVSLQIWAISLVCIGIWALVLAIFRAMQGPWFAPLRVFAILYVDLFRGLPALLLVLLFGFGIPALNHKPGNEPRWAGPYLKKEVPADPWGKPYAYRAPGEHGEYDLFSYGKDGQPGGTAEAADVTNW